MLRRLEISAVSNNLSSLSNVGISDRFTSDNFTKSLAYDQARDECKNAHLKLGACLSGQVWGAAGTADGSVGGANWFLTEVI